MYETHPAVRSWTGSEVPLEGARSSISETRPGEAEGCPCGLERRTPSASAPAQGLVPGISACLGHLRQAGRGALPGRRARVLDPLSDEPQHPESDPEHRRRLAASLERAPIADHLVRRRRSDPVLFPGKTLRC